jgi:hypothetical protein
MPQQPAKLAKATLSALPHGPSITVQFNPATLVYSVENSLAQQSGSPQKVQYVAQFSGKLSMDLQFDTTDSGSDVRLLTNQVAAFMQATGNAQAAAANSTPPSANGQPAATPAKALPVLQFAWGNYTFQGIMDSFKETIDFFSADGVALRALVSIGMSRQDQVFDDSTNLSGPSNAGSLVPSSSSASLTSMATLGGDPSAARQLGSDNGLESLRFTGGASIQVSASPQLNPPAAFVTVSAGAAAGAGISLGVALGVALGVGAGGASAGISASISAGSAPQSSLGAPFGGQASAGVPATAGAFAGLQLGRATASTTANLNPMRMSPATTVASVGTFAGASYSLGGAALSTGSAGASTNVGASFSFSNRLTFSSDD